MPAYLRLFTKHDQTFVLDDPTQAKTYDNITYNTNAPVLTNLI